MAEKDIEKIINTARGLKKADLVIKNAKVVNVLSEEIPSLGLLFSPRWFIILRSFYEDFADYTDFI